MKRLGRRRLFSAGAGAATLGLIGAAAYLSPREMQASPSPAGTKPALNVAAFGAVGDGRADDTAALQAALDAAFAGADARFLDIPPGVYRVTRPLRIETRGKPEGNITHLAGIRAHGARIKSEVTRGQPVLELVSHAVVRFVLIEGLQIQGGGREGAGISLRCLERGTYIYNFCLRDIVVQNCGGDGCAMIGNVFEGQVFNSYFRDNGGNGALFSHGPENTVASAIHVFGCVFGGNKEHGAKLIKGAFDIGFYGCYFLLNHKYGLWADHGVALLSHCGFENNQRAAGSFENGNAGIMLKLGGALVGCNAYSIEYQTHLINAKIMHQLVMVGCTAAGGQLARGARLARLESAKKGAAFTLIGCRGGVDAKGEIDLTEIGTDSAGGRFPANWDSPRLAQLGDYRLWVDGDGRLRIKKGRPTADDDGRTIGG